MLAKVICRKCGKTIYFEQLSDALFCNYCGSRINDVLKNAVIAGDSAPTDTNAPNLIIGYNSIDPKINMMTHVHGTNHRNTYTNGSVITMHLEPGRYIVEFKFSFYKYYKREIIIPATGAVHISAGFSGRTFINIDQP